MARTEKLARPNARAGCKHPWSGLIRKTRGPLSKLGGRNQARNEYAIFRPSLAPGAAMSVRQRTADIYMAEAQPREAAQP
jgi:hypothetical protein